MAHPAGLTSQVLLDGCPKRDGSLSRTAIPPANSPFEAENDNDFTTDAKWWVASESHRVLAGQEPGLHCQSLQPLVAIRKDRNAKAELNHRSQACEVLTGTGVRVAKKIGACEQQRLAFRRLLCKKDSGEALSTGPNTGLEIFVRGVRTYSQDESQSRLRERRSHRDIASPFS